MMWIFDLLINIVSYPIRWFWDRVETYKATQQLWKIILLFVVSLSGVGLLCGVLIWVINYLFTYHPEWVVGAGLIIWLYSYVRSKMPKNDPPPEPDSNLNNLEEQAEQGYPVMRNVMYQTLREMAHCIGGKIPRILQEIELPESRYVIANNICFYQFKLEKEDIRTRYNANDLVEFKRTLQSSIALKLQSGAFPTLKLEKYRDKYGNFYDAIIVDTIEDMDNVFIIQTVFASAEYAEYQRNLRNKQQSSNTGNSVPDATWDNPS